MAKNKYTELRGGYISKLKTWNDKVADWDDEKTAKYETARDKFKERYPKDGDPSNTDKMKDAWANLEKKWHDWTDQDDIGKSI